MCAHIAGKEPALEIHPPEHPIHTWRDFLIHIATIVVGLLIAIGLEQSVEALHHHHQVHTAREQMREELRANRALIAKDQQYLTVAMANGRHNVELLQALNRDPSTTGALAHGWTWEGPDASAWRTAQQTGALAYMPFPEVERLSSVYAQQALVQDEAARYIRAYTASNAPLFRHGDPYSVPSASLTSAERDLLLTSYTQNLTETGELSDLVRGLDGMYAEAERTLP